jgi:hypothetical protein
VRAPPFLNLAMLAEGKLRGESLLEASSRRAESPPPRIGVDVLPHPLLNIEVVRIPGRTMAIRAIDDVLQLTSIQPHPATIAALIDGDAIAASAM